MTRGKKVLLAVAVSTVLDRGRGWILTRLSATVDGRPQPIELMGMTAVRP